MSAGATFTQREEPQPPDDTSHRSSNKRRLYITLKNGLREFPRIPRHDRFPESETHGKASPGVAALTLSLSLSLWPPTSPPPSSSSSSSFHPTRLIRESERSFHCERLLSKWTESIRCREWHSSSSQLA